MCNKAVSDLNSGHFQIYCRIVHILLSSSIVRNCILKVVCVCMCVCRDMSYKAVDDQMLLMTLWAASEMCPRGRYPTFLDLGKHLFDKALSYEILHFGISTIINTVDTKTQL